MQDPSEFPSTRTRIRVPQSNNQELHGDQKAIDFKKFARIFLMTSVSDEKITNLLIVNFQHLHSNLIPENVNSTLSYLKKIIECSVVYSPIRWRHVGRTAL